MQIVHAANTNVEFEYANSLMLSLEKSWERPTQCLQLQFLPLLYASPEDLVAVTALPSEPYLAALQDTGLQPEGLPRLVPLHETGPFEGKECLSRGPSLQVKAWAERRGMKYEIPEDWEAICRVNSKEFSFRYRCLEEAALLHNEAELSAWAGRVQGAKVLKTSFGLAGRGHYLFDSSRLTAELVHFCRKEWGRGRPVIGEPWLERAADFSTQWKIHPGGKIEPIGAVRFETTPQGGYRGTLAGPESRLFAGMEAFLQEHRERALEALQEIAGMGFFGFAGIDALLYRHPETKEPALYPIVEINGRQTLSLVALRLQQRLCPESILRLFFEPDASSSDSLLPGKLADSGGREARFRRRLAVEWRREV